MAAAEQVRGCAGMFGPMLPHAWAAEDTYGTATEIAKPEKSLPALEATSPRHPRYFDRESCLSSPEGLVRRTPYEGPRHLLHPCS